MVNLPPGADAWLNGELLPPNVDVNALINGAVVNDAVAAANGVAANNAAVNGADPNNAVVNAVAPAAPPVAIFQDPMAVVPVPAIYVEQMAVAPGQNLNRGDWQVHIPVYPDASIEPANFHVPAGILEAVSRLHRIRLFSC
jgi:hypothetical protein